MISHSRLLELLHYNPATGLFTRLTSQSTKSPAGTIAKGHIHCRKHRYLRVCVDGKLYNYARLAWLYVHGHWPDREIDHLNDDPTDNRLSNLRLATREQNMQARREYRMQKSGFSGVQKLASGSYQAQISVNGQKQHIGTYDTAEEAYQEWCGAALVLRGAFSILD